MDIRMVDDGEAVRAVVSGEADADNCSELGAALLGDDARGPLRVDLSALSFLDSSAVSELLRIQQELAERDIEMSIVDPSPAVHRVLEITGLLDLFGIPSA